MSSSNDSPTSKGQSKQSAPSSAVASPSLRPISPVVSGPSGPDAVLNNQRHSGKAKYAQKRISSNMSCPSPAMEYAHSPLALPANSESNSVPMSLSLSNPGSSSNVNSNSVRLRKTISNQSERKNSSRRVMMYSTDDDEAEVEADYEQKLSNAYKSGYFDGRRHKAANKRASHGKFHVSPASLAQNNSGTSHHSQFMTLDDHMAADHPDHTKSDKHVDQRDDRASVVNLIHEIEQDKDQHWPGVAALEQKFAQAVEAPDEEDPEISSQTYLDNYEDENDQYDDEEEGDDIGDDDNADVASISSTETFTLRERQDAINITHPFGIRIWKPAVYKKIRSVQRFAEGEIHSGPIRKVSWLVWLGNIFWSFTFGLLLLFPFWMGALFLRIFCFWTRSATVYSRTLFVVGKYLLFPFGISVQLRPDENYLEEDSCEGTTVAEYHEWQTTNTRHLFYAPSNNSNTQPDSSDNLTSDNGNQTDESNATCRSDSSLSSHEIHRKLRFFGRGDWTLGRIVFYFWFYIFIYPLLTLISLICWLGVFSIPMAKVTGILAYHIRRHPLALSFRPASTLQNMPPNEYSNSILLCTYRAAGLRYYKYTVDGTNIFIMNMVAIVPLTIFNYFFVYEYLKVDLFFTQPIFIFCMSLLGIVPLAYFIGQAVASISAQSSMGMGATINAFFSTVVEVYLYCVALSQGKADLVEGSIVGSIFGGILLLPGLSMCFGAIKRKTQRYNPKSAGVSSTMLLFAIISAFAPTIFYQIYGTYEVRCQDCSETGITVLEKAISFGEDCQRCHFYQAPLTSDSLYTDIIKPFSAICSLLLFVAYVIGLWFTLRTHAAMIWQTPTSSELHNQVQNPQSVSNVASVPVSLLPIVNLASQSTSANSNGAGSGNKGQKKSVDHLAEVAPIPAGVDTNVAVVIGAENSGGHDAPNWSRTKSTIILLIATFMYSVIAEVLVDTVDGVLKSVSISEKFVGVTIFALVPNTTEFLNAISFAMNGNIALSMEIGSAYVLQVCLLQIPALVAYSMFVNPLLPNITDFMFTLIFPRWDLLMVVFCVFVFSYIYAEGKSNYFKGSILVLSYLVVMVGFYFTGKTGEAGISSFSLISNGNIKLSP